VKTQIPLRKPKVKIMRAPEMAYFGNMWKMHTLNKNEKEQKQKTYSALILKV